MSFVMLAFVRRAPLLEGAGINHSMSQRMSIVRSSRKILASGFSLPEILVVFAIVGLVTAVTPIALPKIHDVIIERNSLHLVAASLRAARSSAIRDHSEVVVSFDIERRLLITGSVAREIKIPKASEILLKVAASETPTDNRGSIRFFSDGSSTGGTVEFSYGNKKKVISVDWLTGRVQIKIIGDHEPA